MKKLFSLLTLLVLSFLMNGWGQSPIPAYDAAMFSITSPGYAHTGDNYRITGTIKNNGSQVLNELDISWQVNDGEVHSMHKTGLDLPKSFRENFEHTESLLVNQTEDFTLKVWISNPNGEEDLNHSNDTLTKLIQVVVHFPERNILIEEATGAWCPWCPRGPVTYRDVVKPAYPNSILVALHDGDDMATPDGNTVLSSYVGFYPSGIIDRRSHGVNGFGLDTDAWKSSIDQMDTEFTPVELNVYNYYYPDNYEWKIEVVVDFIMDYQANLRLNCYIVEDSVTGNGPGYDQMNAYHTRTDIPELQGIGNPIIGYKHNHVVREMIAGPWGRSNIIPSRVKKGDRYYLSQTIKAKVDRWRMENIHLVGIIQAYNSNKAYRSILNAKEVEVALATGYEQSELESDFIIYPNPVADQAILEFNNSQTGTCKIQIIGVTGQVLEEYQFKGEIGKQSRYINCGDWAPGTYFVRCTQNSQTKIRKLIKSY